MPVVVPVKFPYASRDLWFDPEGLDIVQADYAVCATERGTEIGLVTADPFEVPVAELSAPLKSVIRIADDADLDRADELGERGDAAMADFRELVGKNKLDMKPVGVEFLFGGETAVFYFSAEERVDFRQLVRDLSQRFRIRIDMRQIGVRDETRLAGGYATCGQELCCARFGGQFEPVSIRMAKEQDLPLNSSKISGMCGRLMCCLRYEFEAYKDFKSRAPKKKTLIDTPLGKARIQEYNTPREQLVLRLEGGRQFRVDLADMSCSDGCKKHAEAQGCSSCRPDCVTRSVMEKIESPEIKLALLELDRKNGVDVGDGLDRSDRIAASGPTPGRRHREEGEGSGSTEGRRGRRSGSREGGEAEGSRRQRRRPGDGGEAVGSGSGAGSGRRRRERPEAADAAGAQGSAPAEGAGSGRRRRRRMSSAERDDAFRAAAAREAGEGRASAPEGEGAAAGSRPGRTRRHRSAAPDGGVEGAKKPDTPSVADQLSEGKVKVVRRRPGDGGGTQAPADRDAAAERGHETGADGERSPRPRRRRPRKPRKDTGEGSGLGSDSSSGSSE
ncbi:MAG: regulatory iron-sulfur-containing complex subunit RicT [Collinsella sp.]|nr:regulatory iron-sulfur-containing complex subunit RicT [Collinsella sp.]